MAEEVLSINTIGSTERSTDDEVSDDSDESVADPVFQKVSSSLDDEEGRYKTETALQIQDNLADLYNQNVLTDLDVTVETETFNCHMIVMAAVSNYFRTMLVSGMKESSTKQVPLQFISPGCFKSILDFVYRGSDIFSDDTIDDILEASVLLQMRHLEETCIKFLSANLNPSNCLNVWSLCHKHHCFDIAKLAWNVALTKFEKVMAKTSLEDIQEDILIKLLTDTNLKFKTEDVLCEAILNWVNADPDVRYALLPKLFNFVCLPEVSGDFLYKIYKSDLVKQFPVIEERVDDALKCHLIPKEKESVLMKQRVIRDTTKYRCVMLVIGGSITDNENLRNVSCWDEVSGTWYSLAMIPYQFGEDCATCVIDNQVYVSGGSMALDSVACYDPSKNAWSSEPPLNIGRELHVMVSICNCVYVLGGRNFKRKSGEKLIAEIEMYEIGSKSWNIIGKLNQPVEALAAGVMGSKIFIYGGIDIDGASMNIHCFDVTTKVCTLIVVMDNVYRDLRSIQTQPDQIHLISASGDILVHTGDDSLSHLFQIPSFNRDRFAVISDGLSITVVGGVSDGSRLDDIQKINLHDQTMTDTGTSLGIPMDGLRVHSLVIPTVYLAQQGMSIGEPDESGFSFDIRKQIPISRRRQKVFEGSPNPKV